MVEILLAYYIGLIVFALNGLIYFGFRSHDYEVKAQVNRIYRLVMRKK
jgi:hypothetical protein